MVNRNLSSPASAASVGGETQLDTVEGITPTIGLFRLVSTLMTLFWKWMPSLGNDSPSACQWDRCAGNEETSL